MLSLLAWWFIGMAILAAVDKDDRLRNWIKLGSQISMATALVSFLALWLWPITLIIFFRKRS